MNFVITFGLGTPMKNYAMLFRNKTENEVRQIASENFRPMWCGVYSEETFKSKECFENLTVLESGL